MIAWSGLSPALHSRDLSVTRTAEILDLAGLLDDDRVSSFARLTRARLALLPAPMAADVGDWLCTRSEGGPRSRPRYEGKPNVLAALTGAPGRVFSRRQLLERVWGYDFFGDERVVDVHIRSLRARLGDDAANPRLIATVRGVGYKFVGRPG